MSTLNQRFDFPDQICYVQCGFCTTILLVSVPYSSLRMVVTVRCGHCSSLLSVNMITASFFPLHFLASLAHHDQCSLPKELGGEVGAGNSSSKAVDNNNNSSTMTFSDDHEDDQEIIPVMNVIANKPPEKRQRAPTAYNRFIKEEIKRLKTQNPDMAHKEAFKTAAKNWAHFPPVEIEGDGESSRHGEENMAWESDTTHKVHREGKHFHERKSSRLSILA